jgi:hypothetical protein
MALIFVSNGSTAPTYTLQGSQPLSTTYYNSPSSLPANEAGIYIDVREPISQDDAFWRGQFGMLLKLGNHTDIVWKGGQIEGTFPANTSWDAMHNVYGMTFDNAYSLTVQYVRQHNVGDAFNVNPGCDEFIFADNWCSWTRDNAFQNDFGCGGAVQDNLFDYSFVPYSSRPYSATVPDNSAKVVYFHNNLVRLTPMLTSNPGQFGPGRFWKLDNSSQAGWPGHPRDPKLSLVNNIFRTDAASVCCGDYLIPPMSRCSESSGNIMVWGGQGPFPKPAELASNPGFTLTTDTSVWDNAKAAWVAAHNDQMHFGEIPFPP